MTSKAAALPMHVGFTFAYDLDDDEIDERHFVLSLMAPLNEAVYQLLVNGGSGHPLEEAMEDCLGELDVVVMDVSIMGEACSLGWSTYSQQDYGDALTQVDRMREFFLGEGFGGGEIREMSSAEFEAFNLTDKSAEQLQRLLERWRAHGVDGDSWVPG